MLFADNQNITDPSLNLALEEYLLRRAKTETPIVLFYINEPAVIIGRNQNALAEIDTEYVRANGIHVVRRLSGGGAVFHDLGNLNFSFITHGRENLHNFARFTAPLLRGLRRHGLEAQMRGASDIFVNDKKVSGNAQYATAGRMFSHGTLLFDTNLETLLKALNPRQVEITSNAVQSIRSFVGNIREMLPQDMDIFQLRQTLLAEIFGPGQIPTYDLTDEDWAKVHELAAGRYRNWDWNVGRSPQFNRRKTDQLEGVGKLDVRIDVSGGHIQQIKIFGDFTGQVDVAALEAQLVGIRYEPEAIRGALAAVDLSRYIRGLTLARFVSLLY